MFEDLKLAVEEALIGVRAGNVSPDVLKEARAALGSAIAEGSVPCKECGNAPFGMEQPRVISGEQFTFYEIGCLHCVDGHGVLSPTREGAVEKWNAAQK